MFPLLYTLPSGKIINLVKMTAIFPDGTSIHIFFDDGGGDLKETFDFPEAMQAELEKIKEACEPKPTQPVGNLWEE